MMNTGGVALAGPGGRFDLTDPQTSEMVRHINANPNVAPQYGVTLAEAFALQNMLNRLQAQPPRAPQTTVVQDLRQQVAQATQPQREAGISTLPVDNFRPENYAGGGIVAFATGDVVDADAQAIRQQQAQDPSSGFYEAPARRPTSADLFQGVVSELESTRGRYVPRTLEEIGQAREAAEKAALERAGISGKPLEAREKQLQELKARSAEDKADALRNFLMSTGFRMAAEASRPGNPYARGLGAITQPLSVGAAGAAPEYIAEQKELRKLTADRDKELADIQDKRYAAVLSGRQYDQATKDKEDARIENYDAKILGVKAEMAKTMGAKEAAAAARDPKEMQIFASGHVQQQLAKGDKRPLELIAQEGNELYLRLKAAEDVRKLGITTPAATAGRQIDARTLSDAQERVEKTLRTLTSPQAREYRRVFQTEGAESAKNYKARLVREELENPLATAKPAAPATSRTPAPPTGYQLQ